MYTQPANFTSTRSHPPNPKESWTPLPYPTPAYLGSDLVATLAGLDVDDFPHVAGVLAVTCRTGDLFPPNGCWLRWPSGGPVALLPSHSHVTSSLARAGHNLQAYHL